MNTGRPNNFELELSSSNSSRGHNFDTNACILYESDGQQEIQTPKKEEDKHSSDCSSCSLTDKMDLFHEQEKLLKG